MSGLSLGNFMIAAGGDKNARLVVDRDGGQVSKQSTTWRGRLVEAFSCIFRETSANLRKAAKEDLRRTAEVAFEAIAKQIKADKALVKQVGQGQFDDKVTLGLMERVIQQVRHRLKADNSPQVRGGDISSNGHDPALSPENAEQIDTFKEALASPKLARAGIGAEKATPSQPRRNPPPPPPDDVGASQSSSAAKEAAGATEAAGAAGATEAAGATTTEAVGATEAAGADLEPSSVDSKLGELKAALMLYRETVDPSTYLDLSKDEAVRHGNLGMNKETRIFTTKGATQFNRVEHGKGGRVCAQAGCYPVNVGKEMEKLLFGMIEHKAKSYVVLAGQDQIDSLTSKYLSALKMHEKDPTKNPKPVPSPEAFFQDTGGKWVRHGDVRFKSDFVGNVFLGKSDEKTGEPHAKEYKLTLQYRDRNDGNRVKKHEVFARHVLDWPDHTPFGFPSRTEADKADDKAKTKAAEKLLDMARSGLKFINDPRDGVLKRASRSIRGESAAAPPPPPPFVHCIAGVGRTGTFLAAMELADPKSKLSLEEIIKAQRYNRNQTMVEPRQLESLVRAALQNNKRVMQADPDPKVEDHLYANFEDTKDMGDLVTERENIYANVGLTRVNTGPELEVSTTDGIDNPAYAKSDAGSVAGDDSIYENVATLATPAVERKAVKPLKAEAPRKAEKPSTDAEGKAHKARKLGTEVVAPKPRKAEGMYENVELKVKKTKADTKLPPPVAPKPGKQEPTTSP